MTAAKTPPSPLPEGLQPGEPRLLKAFRATAPAQRGQLQGLLACLAAGQDLDEAIARLAPAMHPETLCTDPRSPRFFDGVPAEEQLRNLKRVDETTYDALSAIVCIVLRESYRHIGPNPGGAK